MRLAIILLLYVQTIYGQTVSIETCYGMFAEEQPVADSILKAHGFRAADKDQATKAAPSYAAITAGSDPSTWFNEQGEQVIWEYYNPSPLSYVTLFRNDNTHFLNAIAFVDPQLDSKKLLTQLGRIGFKKLKSKSQVSVFGEPSKSFLILLMEGREEFMHLVFIIREGHKLYNDAIDFMNLKGYPNKIEQK